MKVRVRYPLESSDGRLLLRLDSDWEHELPPRFVTEDGTCFEFELPDDVPYHYFKPVLRRGSKVTWARGPDRLAVPGGANPDVYPYFGEDQDCEVCVRQRLPHGQGGYEVRVFLPAGYSENTLSRHPVLYMHDGHNLFFPEEAFAGRHWAVRETFTSLDAMDLVQRVIVVGIRPLDRTHEYTRDGWDVYERFLVDELKPWVDRWYRTYTGPEHTVVMGSSLGGVVSLHLAWNRPDVFGGAGCLSSTFGWNDDLFERIAGEAPKPLRLYLDSGWPADNYEVTRSMYELLLSRGYRAGADVQHVAFPGGRHDEDSWRLRLHVPLQFFFRNEAAAQPAARRPRREVRSWTRS